MNKKDLNWYDRKRLWCGLPWTFTKYGMSDDRPNCGCSRGKDE